MKKTTRSPGRSDRHKTPLLAWRPPGELAAWARAEASRRDQRIGEFLTTLLAAEHERAANHASGTPPVTAANPQLPRRSRKPRAAEPESSPEAPSRRRCTHPGTRVIGGYCKTCDHLIEPGGYWR